MAEDTTTHHHSTTPLTTEELKAILLPKWPGLIVAGDSVTHDQAAEIILRTEAPYEFMCNDYAWQRMLFDVLGVPNNIAIDDYSEEADQAKRAAWETLGVLELQYIHNTQIASAYVDGPCGWMHWDGVIGAESFNIGKWPNTPEVLEDWQKIAAEWPFLSLTAQLLSVEACEDTEGRGEVLIEYRVNGGIAEAFRPIQRVKPERRGSAGHFAVFRHRGERGCSIEQFTRAVELARDAVARKTTAAIAAP